MIFKRIRSEGLAAFSYFLGSEKEAVVIDPRRDCQVYVDIAKKEEMKIKYIFETHRHEDFAVGSCELAHMTGALIFHGVGLDFKYGEFVDDKEIFSFGKMRLKAICTPGHTDESVSYVLFDEELAESALMVFSGDTLFVGDVGRVDLYGPKEVSRLAESLYVSVFEKILCLGDGVLLCPAHGGGSICGKAISDREWSTLGIEKVSNPVLQKSKEEFIQYKMNEKLERPPYFRKMEQLNLEGSPLLGGLSKVPALSPDEFSDMIGQGAIVLDVRSASSFGGAHIKKSISIWTGGVAVYSGWFLSFNRSIILVLEYKEQLDLVLSYLVRLGYDRVLGYLCSGDESCGLESWYTKGLSFANLDLLFVENLKVRMDRKDDLILIDVRDKEEWSSGHIKDAVHIYVGHLSEKLDSIPNNKPVAVICSTGNRSSIAASILLKEGRSQVYNVLGGMTAWRNVGFKTITGE